MVHQSQNLIQLGLLIINPFFSLGDPLCIVSFFPLEPYFLNIEVGNFYRAWVVQLHYISDNPYFFINEN